MGGGEEGEVCRAYEMAGTTPLWQSTHGSKKRESESEPNVNVIKHFLKQSRASATYHSALFSKESQVATKRSGKHHAHNFGNESIFEKAAAEKVAIQSPGPQCLFFEKRAPRHVADAVRSNFDNDPFNHVWDRFWVEPVSDSHLFVPWVDSRTLGFADGRLS